MRLLSAAILDAVRGAVGLAPHYIAVYGRAGYAVFSDPALAGLFQNVEENAPSWRNQVTPRFHIQRPPLPRRHDRAHYGAADGHGCPRR